MRQFVFESDQRGSGSVSGRIPRHTPASASQRQLLMADGSHDEFRVAPRASDAVIGRLGRPGRHAGGQRRV